MKMLLKGVWTIAMLLLLPGLCRAQSGWTVYGSGDTSFLITPEILRDLFDPSLGGAVRVGTSLNSYLEVFLGAEYHRMTLSENSVTIARRANNEQGYEEQIVPVEGGELDRLGVSLGVKGFAPLKGSFRPYLMIAVGRSKIRNQPMSHTNPWTGEEFVSTGSERQGFGTRAGIGLDVLLNRYVKLFAETGIHRIFDDTKRNYWGLRLGAGVSPWGR